jgi:hypothetical protein
MDAEGVLRKAVELLKLEENWDSCGGSPICPRTMGQAIDTAFRLGDGDMGFPDSLVPTCSGGVQLEWHTEGFDAELSIEPAAQPPVEIQHEEESGG